MDFLDPKKKRAQKIRLYIGQTLMVLLVLVATYLLVQFANGYKIDEKTGQLIQNGLVYIDSTPTGAQLKISGQAYDNTNTRVSLPEGKYTIEISKEGYRTWKHDLQLDGGEVERLTYPFLFPNTLSPSQINTSNALGMVTQSPDKRWVIMSTVAAPTKLTEYDLNTRTNDLPQTNDLSLPGSLFTNASAGQSLQIVEWSTDNKHFLLQHKWKSGSEFVMVNRDKTSESFNLSKLLDKQPEKVAMIDKKYDQLFLLGKDKSLDKYDVADRQRTNFAKNIISFKPHGSDKVLLSRLNSNKKTAEIVLLEGTKEYDIRDVPIAKDIPLDIAQYDGNWYVAVSEIKSKRTFIYKNPQDLFVQKPKIEDVLTVVLKNDSAIDDLSFSQNARFILSRSGKQLSVYDTEKEERFRYTLKENLSKGIKPYWMDGHRIIIYAGGKAITFEFDEANKQTLVETDPSLPVFFDRDYKELYSFSQVKSGKQSLFQTQLRLPNDR